MTCPTFPQPTRASLTFSIMRKYAIWSVHRQLAGRTGRASDGLAVDYPVKSVYLAMKKLVRSLILLTIVAISGFASAIYAQPLFRVDFNHQAVLIEPDTDKSATKRLEGTLENLTGDSITLTF